MIIEGAGILRRGKPYKYQVLNVLRTLRRPLVHIKNRFKYLTSGKHWLHVCVNSKNDLRLFMTHAGKRKIYDHLLGRYRVLS